jgi:3-oxoacyl-(acyl-carrier-protein) synthase
MAILISGMGIISAMGVGVRENTYSLLNCQTGISTLKFIDSTHKGILPVGEVKFNTQELLSISGHQSIKSRTTQMALIAVEEALRSANLSKDDIKGLKIGVISSSTVGGMKETEEALKDFLDGNNDGNFIEQHDATYTTEKIVDVFEINGFHTTINTACSSSANAIMLGSRMIEEGLLDIAIVGGSDALSKFTINGFNSLLLLDTEHCKPFDENRVGINLGEGAGYLILESKESLSKRNSKPIAKILGYANTNDAYHQSSTSPDGIGIQNAIYETLKMAGISKEEVGYVNAHGTATPNNDLTEGNALKFFFNDKLPLFSSTKSYTGHCLAAAASIETIVSIIAIHNNCVFPNLNFNNPIAHHQLEPLKEITRIENLDYVLNISAGMGGFCSTLLIAKC